MIKDTGPYFVYELTDDVGFSFSCAYYRKERDFQILLSVLDMAMAIGWRF